MTVAGRIVGSIPRGLLVYLGVGRNDTPAAVPAIVDKVVNLRIFPDEAGKMNLSVKDTGGSVLVVSQFTLFGDCRKGRRPSYSDAMEPAAAQRLYDEFMRLAADGPVPVAGGEFQAMMDVELVNDGPVTLLLDSRRQF